jgi:hypothetical protein
VTGGPDSQVAAGPAPEALDRLYRPQALDVPVMAARDAPISTLSPASVGALAVEVDRTTPPPPTRMAAAPAPDAAPGGADAVPAVDGVAAAVAQALGLDDGSAPPVLADAAGTPAAPDLVPPSGVHVTEAPAPAVQLVAVRPVWVRVRSAEGSTLFERIMETGETYSVPHTENPPNLRVGDAGGLYFAVNGAHYGPVRDYAAPENVANLSAEALTAEFAQADLNDNAALAEAVCVADARQSDAAEQPAPGRVTSRAVEPRACPA